MGFVIPLDHPFPDPQDTWSSRSQSLYLEMRDHKALLKVSGVWWVGPSTPFPYFLATHQAFLNKLFFFFNATLVFWKHTSKNSSKKYFILSKRVIFISLLRDGFFGVCFCFFFALIIFWVSNSSLGFPL